MGEAIGSEPWRVFPSRHGILLKAGSAGSNEREVGAARIVEHAPRSEFFLQQNDAVIGVEDTEPPLALQLCREEIEEMRDGRLAAASHYGPLVQEKTSNEDFALSAVIRAHGSEFAFAAVADGVSTRTFWAARTARIACIGAYKAVRELLLREVDIADDNKHRELADRVAEFIGHALSEDSQMLEASNSVPGGWDRVIYEKHKADKTGWYRSTLLFGVIGANGGVIGLTGDGGVRGLLLEDEKDREPSELRVMFSESGRDLTSYVSQNFSSQDIQLLPLRSKGRRATHVVFASDGLDLTLQQYLPNDVQDEGRRCHSRYRDLPLENSRTSLEFLESLSKASSTVRDNLSVARLSWPLPRPNAKWSSWRRENFKRWKLSDRQDSGVRAHVAGELNRVVERRRWLLPAVLGLAIGSIFGSAATLAGIVSLVGYERLKADILLDETAQNRKSPDRSGIGIETDSKHQVIQKQQGTAQPATIGDMGE